MKLLRLMLIGILLASLPAYSFTNYHFRTIDVKDGLSDNFVRDITRDSYGYIWFSTIHGLSRFDGYNFYNYMPHDFGGTENNISMVRETADSTLWMVCGSELYTYSRGDNTWKKDGASRLEHLGMVKGVSVFYVDPQQNIWAASNEMLYHYDYSSRTLHTISNFSHKDILHLISKNEHTIAVTSDYAVYEVNVKEKRLIPISQVPDISHTRDSRVYLDNYKNLWVYNSHSLAGTQWILSLDTHQWHQHTEFREMGNVFVNAVAEDNDGHLWMGTGNAGIHIFSTVDGGKTYTEESSMDAFGPHISHITGLFLDENNTMWVGSAKLGVAFTDLNYPQFSHTSTGDHQDVSTMLQDSKGNLWIGFDGGGVMMKTASGASTHFSASRHQLPSDIITVLSTLPDGTVLAGTYGEGIAKYDGNKFVSLFPDSPTLKYVKDMTVDGHNHLWVATVDKGVVRVSPDGKMVNYTMENSTLAANGTLCVIYDPLHDMIFIGTSMGLSVYDCANAHFIENALIDRLKGAYISSLMMHESNELWIGSRNGLWIYQFKNNLFTHYTTEQGLSHNTIRAMAATGNYVWVSTDNGLTCLSKPEAGASQNEYQCNPFKDTDGFYHVVFSNNAALTTTEGTAILGCYTGYVSIMPNEVIAQHPKFHIVFTDFLINGKSVKAPSSGISLAYGNRLVIYVSAMLPAQSNKVRYLYRFNGDQEWIRVPDNFFYFSSLQPGTHILQVKASIPGIASSQIAELYIKVSPPFFLSIPAIIFYLILIATALYLFFRNMQRKQKRDLSIKQMEMDLKKYEMEEDKIRFFTNIGHDLKTPLTLVMAPLEKIRGFNLSASIRTEIDVAWRNARQLYDQVLQMLDFRRLDVGMERLNFRHGDIVGFVRQTAQNFNYYATNKHIQLRLNLPSASEEIDFDENKMRRILTNLLSNAFKYNIDHGFVDVELLISKGDDKRHLVLRVADTGIGVTDKRHIFDRFIQESHGQEQEGSGIGLHIVKHYTDMMGGQISVTDNKPRGTVFTITIPLTEGHSSEQQELPEEEPLSLSHEMVADDGVEEKPTILVVDDNMDARLFLQRSLSDEYQVIVAGNGKEALKQLSATSNISIVISDVMMPVMDGIELFRTLKSNIKYSHIPVILLTAKSSEESIVSGLEEGAADYITKPFSLAVLRLRIRKILEWSSNVHLHVAKGIEIKPSEITVSSIDEELITHVISEIEANIQDMDYSVVQLSSAVGMTRGHLYKKLMSITGKSPLEFIRIIKMKRGKSLLDQGKTNISEVAYMVGLSAKQFTHYFKTMYNNTPSEYLKEQKNNPKP